MPWRNIPPFQAFASPVGAAGAADIARARAKWLASVEDVVLEILIRREGDRRFIDLLSALYHTVLRRRMARGGA
jgi:hypothetical protein